MKELTDWFLANSRSFPWREERSPYRVWVSEVMLQQTRASVVIAYFERWMELFPTVESLNEAPLEKVIKAWEGLGYYSRARNLHLGAKEVCLKFSGVIPDTKEALSTIPGLGPYTTGAILSFGFQKKAAAVDGNVARVIARYFAITDNICRAPVRRLIEEKTEGLLGDWVTMEALIELGALVCKPKPLCGECPLKNSCLGLKQGIAENLPIKNGAPEISKLSRFVVILESDGKVLVSKGEKGKLMADLYQFPYFEEIDALDQKILKRFGCRAKLVRKLKEVMHTFTRYKAHLHPFVFAVKEAKEIAGFSWVDKNSLSKLPFCSGHRTIAKEIVS